MDDDDGGNPNERFHMDNDYEGGQWIDGEFFYTKKKEKRKQTKEDILYGVFADSDSDGDGGRRKRGKETTTDYTAPVGFVKSAVINDPSQPPEASSSGRAGLGAGTTAGLGMGFRSAGVQQGAVDNDDDIVLPNAFGQRLKEAAEARRKQEESQRAQRQKQKQNVGDREAANVGTFEAHTKGIGSKLLAKMGYKPGMGLGRSGTGMASALETVQRPKNMGLGAGNFAEQPKSRQAAAAAEAAGPAPGSGAPGAGAGLGAGGGAAAAPQAGRTVPAWKKKAKEVRQKRVYKTAEEVLAEREASGAAGAPVLPIIDMRGPQRLVLTNLERLKEAPPQAAAEEDGTPLPEVQYNLKILADDTEARIAQIDEKLRRARDDVVRFGREQARLQAEAEAHAARAARAQELMDAVSQADAAAAEGGLSLPELAGAFRALRQRYPEEWAAFGLAELALARALPAAQRLFAGWSPLADPGRGAAEMAQWRGVLESPSAAESIFVDPLDDPFGRLLGETALPPLRSQVANAWDPRDPEPLLVFFERWERALPPSSKAQLLDHSVMPKLRAAVDAWDPRTETVAIHLWIHPWLHILGSRLEPLYAPIRFKLGSALAAWHPSDGSALALLAPWQRVFAPGDWEALLVRCIAPKLAFALSELVINPAQQALDPLLWVLAWADAMPARHLAALLETGFFPKWLAVLHQWLSARPDYDEVTRWFLGWKGLFPESVLAHDKVRRAFNAALDLMNQALAGQVGPLPPGLGAPPAPAAPAPEAPPPPPPEDMDLHGAALTLRELVERFAEEHDVLFMPRAGRTERGLQVYGFGKVSVIVDNAKEEIFAQESGKWVPVSMSQLLERNGR